MASNEVKITLITGANGGIGFEIAAQLLAQKTNFVLLGSRSLEKGQAAVSDLTERNLPGKVELVHIDVDSEGSIYEAAKTVGEKYGRIDALVNNAAITGETPTNAPLSQRLSAAFLTNATGPAIVVEAFAGLLQQSQSTPRIVNVSSGAGSIAMRLDDTNPHQKMKAVPYRASKAALNMITACQAYEYGSLGWKVFCICPGFTVSQLSDMNKAELGAQPTSEGAAPIVSVLEGKRDAEHGGFLKADGQWPW
ncbi:hypothetical protein BKA66DRAFT_507610 [Pyrenochaeta sp. MPI-SDFR-AT-0127]|nr:hypothetical protein BKA66DRAFT_507610 [Pyrenochaeta sp. MPI-SDFR-AT-0127]